MSGSIVLLTDQHSGSVHGYSEIRSRSNVWKEHTHTEGHIYIYDYTHFLLQILGLFISYILGKWLQKEDIAAVHFVLKWGFEVSPVSNNSRMLETKDFRDIASAYMPLKRACKLTQGQSVINQKNTASCRVLNCGYFGTKCKVIGHVEEELWFFYHF